MEHRIHHIGSLANSGNMGRIGKATLLIDFMPYLLGFTKARILDLLTMLFHPAKVQSMEVEVLSNLCSGYCARSYFCELEQSLDCVPRLQAFVLGITLGFEHSKLA